MTAKNLPLPFFTEICETYAADWTTCGWATLALICPDPNAGRRARYSVLRLNRLTGYTRCIGRELDIVTARAVARRASSRDGQPVSDIEQRNGRASLRTFYAKQGTR